MLTNEYGEKVHAPGAAAIDKSLRRIYDFDNCCINFDDEAGQDILPRIAVCTFHPLSKARRSTN